ncbi:hypothetical protein E2320_016022 [Naja naja]|nr:hypothetical protein E2320_016022 [Naja naja]
MDSRVGHQVGLKFCQIYIQGTIKSQGSCNGGHNLTDKAVEVGVGGALNVQVPSANVIDGFVVYHEGTVECSKVVSMKNEGKEDESQD